MTVRNVLHAWLLATLPRPNDLRAAIGKLNEVRRRRYYQILEEKEKKLMQTAVYGWFDQACVTTKGRIRTMGQRLKLRTLRNFRLSFMGRVFRAFYAAVCVQAEWRRFDHAFDKQQSKSEGIVLLARCWSLWESELNVAREGRRKLDKIDQINSVMTVQKSIISLNSRGWRELFLHRLKKDWTIGPL